MLKLTRYTTQQADDFWEEWLLAHPEHLHMIEENTLAIMRRLNARTKYAGIGRRHARYLLLKLFEIGALPL